MSTAALSTAPSNTSLKLTKRVTFDTNDEYPRQQRSQSVDISRRSSDSLFMRQKPSSSSSRRRGRSSERQGSRAKWFSWREQSCDNDPYATSMHKKQHSRNSIGGEVMLPTKSSLVKKPNHALTTTTTTTTDTSSNDIFNNSHDENGQSNSNESPIDILAKLQALKANSNATTTTTTTVDRNTATDTTTNSATPITTTIDTPGNSVITSDLKNSPPASSSSASSASSASTYSDEPSSPTSCSSEPISSSGYQHSRFIFTMSRPFKQPISTTVGNDDSTQMVPPPTQDKSKADRRNSILKRFNIKEKFSNIMTVGKRTEEPYSSGSDSTLVNSSSCESQQSSGPGESCSEKEMDANAASIKKKEGGRIKTRLTRTFLKKSSSSLSVASSSSSESRKSEDVIGKIEKSSIENLNNEPGVQKEDAVVDNKVASSLAPSSSSSAIDSSSSLSNYSSSEQSPPIRESVADDVTVAPKHVNKDQAPPPPLPKQEIIGFPNPVSSPQLPTTNTAMSPVSSKVNDNESLAPATDTIQLNKSSSLTELHDAYSKKTDQDSLSRRRNTIAVEDPDQYADLTMPIEDPDGLEITRNDTDDVIDGKKPGKFMKTLRRLVPRRTMSVFLPKAPTFDDKLSNDDEKAQSSNIVEETVVVVLDDNDDCSEDCSLPQDPKNTSSCDDDFDNEIEKNTTIVDPESTSSRHVLKKVMRLPTLVVQRIREKFANTGNKDNNNDDKKEEFVRITRIELPTVELSREKSTSVRASIQSASGIMLNVGNNGGGGGGMSDENVSELEKLYQDMCVRKIGLERIERKYTTTTTTTTTSDPSIANTDFTGGVSNTDVNGSNEVDSGISQTIEVVVNDVKQGKSKEGKDEEDCSSIKVENSESVKSFVPEPN